MLYRATPNVVSKQTVVIHQRQRKTYIMTQAYNDVPQCLWCVDIVLLRHTDGPNRARGVGNGPVRVVGLQRVQVSFRRISAAKASFADEMRRRQERSRVQQRRLGLELSER